jgi:hypothetical protein
MKKIRLTESELINLIKKVIIETEEVPSGNGECYINCMPMMGSLDAEGKLRKSCCDTRRDEGINSGINSSACKTYINKHKPGSKNCKFSN